jgi:hypothetical protein
MPATSNREESEAQKTDMWELDIQKNREEKGIAYCCVLFFLQVTVVVNAGAGREREKKLSRTHPFSVFLRRRVNPRSATVREVPKVFRALL